MKYFNVYFSGETLEHVTQEQLKINLAKLFKTDLSRIDKMFTGQVVLIKKSLVEETLKRYQQALKKAGAKIIVKELAVTTDTVSPAKAPPVQDAIAKSPSTTVPETKVAELENNRVVMSSGLAGLINYNQSTKQQVEPFVEENTQGLSISPANTGSLEEFSKSNEHFDLPDLSDYSLAQAASGSLEQYATKVVAVEIKDISYMDMTDKNNRPLSDQTEKQQAIELPNIHHLNMLDATTGSLEEFAQQIEAFDLDSIDDIQLEKDGSEVQ